MGNHWEPKPERQDGCLWRLWLGPVGHEVGDEYALNGSCFAISGVYSQRKYGRDCANFDMQTQSSYECDDTLVMCAHCG